MKALFKTFTLFKTAANSYQNEAESQRVGNDKMLHLLFIVLSFVITKLELSPGQNIRLWNFSTNRSKIHQVVETGITPPHANSLTIVNVTR